MTDVEDEYEYCVIAVDNTRPNGCDYLEVRVGDGDNIVELNVASAAGQATCRFTLAEIDVVMATLAEARKIAQAND